MSGPGDRKTQREDLPRHLDIGRWCEAGARTAGHPRTGTQARTPRDTCAYAQKAVPSGWPIVDDAPGFALTALERARLHQFDYWPDQERRAKFLGHSALERA